MNTGQSPSTPPHKHSDTQALVTITPSHDSNPSTDETPPPHLLSPHQEFIEALPQQLAKVDDIHRGSLQFLYEGHEQMTTILTLLEPQLSAQFKTINSASSRVASVQHMLMDIYKRLRKLRADLEEVGISFDDEIDPLKLVEERDRQELECMRLEFERRKREQAAAGDAGDAGATTTTDGNDGSMHDVQHDTNNDSIEPTISVLPHHSDLPE